MKKYEKETIIIFNEEEPEAEIYTCSSAIMTKVDKLCEKNPENYRIVNSSTDGKRFISKTYKFNKNLITLRGKKRKCNFSEKEIENIKNRFKKA